jgi:hypothetical protein
MPELGERSRRPVPVLVQRCWGGALTVGCQAQYRFIFCRAFTISTGPFLKPMVLMRGRQAMMDQVGEAWRFWRQSPQLVLVHMNSLPGYQDRLIPGRRF